MNPSASQHPRRQRYPRAAHPNDGRTGGAALTVSDADPVTKAVVTGNSGCPGDDMSSPELGESGRG